MLKSHASKQVASDTRAPLLSSSTLSKKNDYTALLLIGDSQGRIKRAHTSQSIAFPLIAYIRVAQERSRTDTPRVGTKAESDRHAANEGASP
jgi:hypothetical protein